jgi:methionyl-tRNA formyltransferase
VKRDLFYIGSSPKAIEIIINSTIFELKKVFCLEHKINQHIIDLVSTNDLPLISFKSREEFEKILYGIERNIPFLIYQLDMIVPASVANQLPFFNIHAGNMSNNRGANPIIWSIINGDKTTELTLHRINEKIDQGQLISTYKIEIDLEKDDALSVKNRLENGLPILLENLNAFLNKKIIPRPIDGGIYRKAIKEEDFTIDILNDSFEQIRQKIKSQKQYKGAVIKNSAGKFYITEIIKIAGKNFNNLNARNSDEFITVCLKNEAFHLLKNKNI